MACLFTCILYVILAILGGGALIKAYIWITMGRHKIKVSLKGKVVVITGGTAGIGKETVRELAKAGATVHVLARDPNKAARVISEIKETVPNADLHVHQVNLSDFATVRTFAKKYLETGAPIHMLINNAGLTCDKKKITTDGNEETTQANHLSHFLLTNLLLKRIVESAPSRIVNLSSIGHAFVYKKDFDAHDINFEKPNNQWTSLRAYNWSKLMNVLFTRELASRLHGKGVSVNAVHPGGVATELVRGGTWRTPELFIIWLIGRIFFKTLLEGAQTTLYVATAEELEHVSGQYFQDCSLAAPSILSVDDEVALELWKESEKLTGLGK